MRRSQPCTVCSVDYDHYDRISSVFEESHYLERNPDGSGVVHARRTAASLSSAQTVERVERL